MVNSWIDSPVRTGGRYHRDYRHDWKRTPFKAFAEFLPWFKERFITVDGEINVLELAKVSIGNITDKIFKEVFGQDLPPERETLSPKQLEEMALIVQIVLQHLELDGVFNRNWLSSGKWDMWGC